MCLDWILINLKRKEKKVAGKKRSGTKARSAITGRYVKKGYATKHPKTTVVETSKTKKK